MTDLDDELAARIAAAVRAHEAAHPHHTEAEIRGWIADAVATGNDGGTPLLPVGRVSDDRLILGVDPSRPKTMNQERPFGQAWAAANMFQLREVVDWVARQLPMEQRTGYGLRMRPDGSVHSWIMDDGTTVRYGPIDRAGQKRFRLASQFRGPQDGYQGSLGNRRFSGGREVFSGGWLINTVLNREEGRSDARTFDGTRSGLSGIGANIEVGPDAEEIVFAWEQEGTDLGAANVAGPIDLHEPGHKLTGPFVVHTYRGKMIFGGKSSKSDQPLDYRAANQTRDLVDHRLAVVDAPEPGERVRFVCRVRVDRTGRRSLFELYRVTERDMELVSRSTDPFGYGFTGAENGKFYPIVQCYLSGAWATPTSRQVRSGMLVWNHDPAVKVYAMEFGTVAVAQGVSAEEMAGHLLSFSI